MVDKILFIKSAIGLGQYSRFTGVGSGSLLAEAADAAIQLNERGLQANCIQSLGDIALQRSEHDQAGAIGVSALSERRFGTFRSERRSL